jgi:hypothetical protein
MTGSIEMGYQDKSIFSKQNDQSQPNYTSNHFEQRAADKYALKIGLLIRAGSVALFVAVASIAYLFGL